MKEKFDKIFVNVNKIKEHEFHRLLHSEDDLSVRGKKWNIPVDVVKTSSADIHRFETYIGLGRWNAENPKNRKPYILIVKKGEPIYLSERIVSIMYHSLKSANKDKEERGGIGNDSEPTEEIE